MEGRTMNDISPALVLVCALCIFAAGLLAGTMVHGPQAPAHYDPSEAGDTHASADWLAPAPTPAITTRRVRALSAELKPSYDSRTHGTPPRPMPPSLPPTTTGETSCPRASK
jgi:hypothetical protein